MDIYYYDIADKLNIEKGETIIISSNLSLLLYQTSKQGISFDFNRLIDSFIEKIGPNGNILLPAYNWDFCSKKIFDYNNTLSTTGALANEAMKRSDFIRSKHPVNSHVIYGKDRDKLLETDYISSYGKESIFTELYKYNVKYVFLGVNLTAFTYLHHFEQELGVPYRYLKYFTGNYIDKNNISTEKTYSVYVRRLEDDPNYHLKDMSDVLLQNNAGKEYIFNRVPYYVYDIEKCKPLFYKDIKKNHSYTYMKFKDGYNPLYQTEEFVDNFSKTYFSNHDIFNKIKEQYFGELLINNNVGELFINGLKRDVKNIEFNITNSISDLKNAIIEINNIYNNNNKEISHKITLY